jgi:hypothetical protein
MPLIELGYRKEVLGEDSATWTGRREFKCPKSEAEQHEVGLWTEPWNINSSSGPVFPRTIRVKRNNENDPGESLIIVTYRSFTGGGGYTPGRASLSVRTNTQAMKMVFSENEYIIDEDLTPSEDTKYVIDGEIDSDDDGNIQYHRPQAGAMIYLKPNSQIVIKTAYYKNEINWNTILGLIGCTNSGTMPNIGNAGPGTLRLMEAGIPKYMLDYVASSDVTIPIQYVFGFEQGGHWGCAQRKIQVNKYSKKPSYVPVNAADGSGYVSDDDNDDVVQDVTQAKHATVMREKVIVNYDRIAVLRTASFSALYGLLQW